MDHPNDAETLDALWEYFQQAQPLQPAPVNTIMGGGTTWLMLMARSGRVDRVEFVLDRGAAIDHRDHRGSTAVLVCYSTEGQYSLAMGLKMPKKKQHRDRGADPSMCDNDGRTALMLAANSPDRADTMNLLLRHDKVDVDAVNRDGFSALETAFGSRSLAAEAALLEAGADPSWRERHGLSLPEFIETAIEQELNPRHLQAWYRTYSLVKARHLHDAVTNIRDRPMTAQRVSTRRRTQQERVLSAPACLQQRVRAGGCLPEVELRVLEDEDEEAHKAGWRGSKRLRDGRDDRDSGGRGNRALGSRVVGYAAAEMSRELFVEMMGWVPITADAETSAGVESTAEA